MALRLIKQRDNFTCICSNGTEKESVASAHCFLKTEVNQFRDPAYEKKRCWTAELLLGIFWLGILKALHRGLLQKFRRACLLDATASCEA
jgi:hypothetical protein